MTILNPITFPVILESLLASNDLTEKQSKYLMNSWLENKIEPVQTGAFLAAFRAKGISGDELSVMAKILQEASTTPSNLPRFDLVDTLNFCENTLLKNFHHLFLLILHQ